jgi:hypothetical protein
MAELNRLFEGGVVLFLSDEEARTLHLVLSNVGGCPKATPRKHCDAIYEVLNEALHADKFRRLYWALEGKHASLYFSDTPNGETTE